MTSSLTTTWTNCRNIFSKVQTCCDYFTFGNVFASNFIDFHTFFIKIQVLDQSYLRADGESVVLLYGLPEAASFEQRISRGRSRDD